MAGLGVLAACGDDDAGGETADPPAFLVPTFPDGYRGESVLAAGIEQRISFVLRDEVDTMRANAPATIELAITSADGATIVSGPVAAHADGIITPYYPVRFTAPAPGEYVATVTDHTDVDPIPFVVLDRAEVAIPQVGDPMRPVDTPTVDDARGVDPICTRADPCEFHAATLTDTLAAGGPSVLLVSTPGFCQTDICGPVLDLLIEAATGRDDLGIVHAEVYVDPSQFAAGELPEVTEAVAAYDLPYEPALFVADAEGTIVARLDTTWDRAELEAALALV